MAEPPESPEQHDGRDADPRRRGFVRRHWPKLLLSSLVEIVVVCGIGLKLFIDSTHPPEPGDFYRAASSARTEKAMS